MQAGKVTALIGPSGCGKSTFLRILNRMHELVPSASLSGSITLDGVDIYGPALRVTETRLKIGMVFQRPNPFPSMTIAQNVLAGLRLSGSKVSNRDALVKDCLERAGLWREARNSPQSGRRRALGWTAATSVHRPGPGRPPQGPAHGRALFGPRPDLHRCYRGDDQGAQPRAHHRDRHPQHATGPAGLRLTAPSSCSTAKALRATLSRRARRTRSSRIPVIRGRRTTCTDGSGERPSLGGRAWAGAGGPREHR